MKDGVRESYGNVEIQKSNGSCAIFQAMQTIRPLAYADGSLKAEALIGELQ